MTPNRTSPFLRWTLRCVVAVLAALWLPATAALGQIDDAAPWPKLGGNLQNSGQSPFGGAGQSSWQQPNIGRVRTGTSIAADGTIYVAAGPFGNASLYALDPADGSTQFTFTPADLQIGSTQPVVGSDGTIYIGGENANNVGVLYAVDAAGNQQWAAASFGAPVEGAPAIAADGTIYVSVDDFDVPGAVYALDPADGDTLWSEEINGASAPTIAADGTVYVGADDGTIYALNPATETASVLTQLGGDFPPALSSPALAVDGTIYVTGRDKVYAFDPDTGAQLWSTPFDRFGSPTPAVVGPGGTVYVGLAGEVNGAVYAFDPDNGSQRWKWSGANIDAMPVVASNGTVYAGESGSSASQLIALDPADGSTRWSFDLGASLNDPAALAADGTVYLGTNDGARSVRGPVADVTPATLDFGDVEVGATANRTTTIENTGDVDLVISDVNVSGPDAADFSIASGGGSGSLAPGGTQDVEVAFAPSAPSSASASLNLETSVGTETVSLSGFAFAAPIAQTDPATNVTGDGATLNGTVDPNGAQTTVTFEYGTTSDFGASLTAEQSPLTGDGEQDVSANLSGLQPGTTYFVRVNASNSAGADAGAQETFTTLAPALDVEPDSLDFGAVTVGATANRTTTIENTGDADLQITDISLGGPDAADFSIASGGGSGSLEPGGIQGVDVAFAPQSGGDKNASLTIATDAGNESVSLIGAGQAVPTAQGDPATDVTENSATLNGAVNPGGAQTTARFEYFPTGAPDATQTVDAEQSPLPPGTGDQAVSAGIAELDPGVQYSFRAIAANAAGSDTSAAQTFTTNGAPGLSLTPSALDFGAVAIGAPSALTTTAQNTGTANLQISGANVSGPNAGDFVLVSGGGSGSLAPGDTRLLTVEFTSPSLGPRSAVLTVETDIGNRDVPMSGEGQAPPTLDYGNVVVGESLDGSVTVNNEGDGNLEILEVTIEGPDAGHFQIVSGGGSGTLGPGRQRVVGVRFEPLSTGDKSATLVVDTDADDRVVDLVGTGVAPTASVTNSGTPRIDNGLTVTASFSSPSFQPDSGQLFYRQAGRTGAGSYQSVDFTQSGGAFQATVPPAAVTLRGVEYYAQFSDGPLTITFPSDNPAANPTGVRVAVDEQTSPVAPPPRTYRMISVPVALADSASAVSDVLEDDLGDPGPTSWRLLRWDPGAARYEELPALADDFEPGTAFWLITDAGGDFDVENGQSVDAENAQTVTLESGWNQIANPFAFPVAWADVERPPTVEAPVFFDGTTYAQEPVQVLEPWEGYFVFNSGSETTISIPPDETGGAPGANIISSSSSRTASSRTTSSRTASSASTPRGTPVSASASPQMDYTLGLRARHGALRDTRTAVGLAAAAAPGRGPMDIAEPPGIGNYVRLSAIEDGQRLDGSFKPAGRGGQWWDLEVRLVLDEGLPAAPQRVTVTLASETGRLPEDYRRYVFDRDAGRPLPLDDQRFTVEVNRDHPVQHLRLVLGTPSFAEAHSEGAPLEPVRFALEKNYPNPFGRKETTIRYQLNRRSDVSLKVYNLLGQHVATLVDEEQNAGPHEVTWRGAGLASGVYLYRLRAGSFTASRKMILLR